MTHCSNCGKYLEDCAGVWVHMITLHRRCFAGYSNGVRVFSDDVAEACAATGCNGRGEEQW